MGHINPGSVSDVSLTKLKSVIREWTSVGHVNPGSVSDVSLTKVSD